MGVFTPGTHGSTFGGNPLACAVGPRGAATCWSTRTWSRTRRRWASTSWRGLREVASPHVAEIRGRGPADRRGAAAGGRRGAPLLRGAAACAGSCCQGDARQHDPLRAAARHHARGDRLGAGAHRADPGDAVGPRRGFRDAVRSPDTRATLRHRAASAIVCQRPRSSGDRARDF
ncbi:MAG: hypothetical protein MZW92_20435 [Comamonadaceae bacterium]|nr:hypothetical protein [Comamonadaceae bacterium]